MTGGPQTSTVLPPPVDVVGPLEWIRRNLLSPWWNAALTLVAVWICFETLFGIYGWSLRDAAFSGGPEACEGIDGACWPFVADTYALFLVGIYPEDERWRPYLCFGLLFALSSVSLVARGRVSMVKLYAAWGAVPFILVAILHGGSWLGLKVVSTTQWGGLMLTVLLSIIGIALAFPLGVLLALGRRSRKMPAVKALCVAFIELIRGVPLISILFLASVLVPLFLPAGVQVDALIRAQIGIILFQAGYLAEVVRGGLQAVPRGQEEAAQSMGLKYVQVMLLVVLPQAMRIVIPALTNQFIIILKDTSLVAIVGLFDLLGIAEVTIRNPKWLGKTFEAYAVVGAFYWIMCFTISRVSLRGRFERG